LYAGKLRTVRVHITGYNAPTPPPEQVPALMESFIRWLRTVKGHPLRISADAHLKLVDIHPFRDGNGRTARLFMAVLLLQSGYPIPALKDDERRYYIQVVHNAIEGKQKQKYYGWFLKVLRREMTVKPQKPHKVVKRH
jgi:Fic family protein